MSKYNTNQKKLLADFLQSNKEKEYTIEEIVSEMTKVPDSPGKSTIYRLIGKMLENGDVRRYESHDKKNFVYQYNDIRPDCCNHFHLKCIKCGRLIHMECEQLEAVKQHVLEDHGFIIGGEQVINGICVNCSNLEK